MLSVSVKSRNRWAQLCLSTILCTGLAAPALAQNSPSFRELDPNGVDLTKGDFLSGFVEGSIGSGDGELVLQRIVRSSGISGLIGNSQWDNILLNQVSGSGTFVEFGNVSYKFPGAESRGATLSGGQYRSPDGTVVTFSDPNAGESDISNFCGAAVPSSNCMLIPTSIKSPDGKTVGLVYEFWRRCERPLEPDEPVLCIFTPRLASVSNTQGYSITFSYASAAGGGRTNPPATFRQRTGATFRNTAAGSGVLASTSYSYPSSGVTQITDTAGRAWQVTNLLGTATIGVRRPGAVSDTTSATVNVSTGIISSVTNEGVATNYSRSVSGTTATMTVTNALSQVMTVVSDLTIGRPTSVTNALSQTTSYQYDGNGRLTEATLPEGNKAVSTYDARGNVTSTTVKAKPGSGLADIVTTASYPATCTNPVTCNSPEWTRDAKGNQTDYTYDPTHGGVLTVTAPADVNGIRPQTRYSYTLTSGAYLLTGTSVCQSSASCAGSASEFKTAVTYGSNLLPTSVTASAGDGSISATTATTYDLVGNIKTVDGPLAGADDTTTYRYDSGRRQTGVVGPDPDGGGVRKPAAQRMTYGNEGLTLKESGYVNDASDGSWPGFSSQEQVAIGYDAYARPIKTELKSGGTTYAVAQTSYDGLGRVDCTAQRMNSATFGSLPSSACSLGTTGTGGPDRITKTIYDAVGRVAKVQTAYGTAQQSDEATTGYTNNGLAAYSIDAENNRTASTYDGHDRLVKTEYPSATKGANAVNVSDYEQLTYDANGNVTNRRLRDGTSIGYGYDNLNRLTSKDLPGSEPDASYGYDLLGRMTAANQGGNSLGFGYDALGRNLTQSGWPGALSASYDAAGRRTSLVYPGSGLTVGYTYDATGAMTEIRENPSGSNALLASFVYDDLGRRTSLTRGNGTVTSYSHDPVSRLSSMTQDLAGTAQDLTLGFSYNPASQIAAITRSNDSYAWTQHYNIDRNYTANGLNQYSTAGSTSLGYDARGNLTSSGSSSYTYSSENHLLSAPGGASAAYDPLGRLYFAGISAPWTYLGYDGDRQIAEYDSWGGALRRYVHGPGVDEPLVWYEGAGTSDKRWLHADERGSIVAISNSAGATTNINTYDEYGIPAASNIGRFGYTGQAWIPELGMWNYKARIYSPTLGRFMQTDPIGYGDGMNWYNYVGSDPVNGTDPSGEEQRAYSENSDADMMRGRLGGDEWEHNSSGLITHSYDGLGAAYGDLITSVGGRVDNIAFEREQKKQIDRMKVLAGYYKGNQTFGEKPEQSGSVVGTERSGFTSQARADLDNLARLNRATPPSTVEVKNLAAAGWIWFTGPTQAGIRNVQTGLIGRFDGAGYRIEIPSGLFIAPGIRNNTGLREVVHYRYKPRK